jgi:hypothetical protein
MKRIASLMAAIAGVLLLTACPGGDITVLPGGGGSNHDTTSCTRQLSYNWTQASLTLDITTVPCPFTVAYSSSSLQFSFLVRGPNASFDLSGNGPYVNSDIEGLRDDHTSSNLALISFAYFSADPNWTSPDLVDA